MIIQIDTDNMSENDLYFLRLLLDADNLDLKTDQADTPQRSASTATGKTKTRGRRNTQQIAYDDALAAFQGPSQSPVSAPEFTALQAAATDLQKRDPKDERLIEFARIALARGGQPDEPTSVSENAEAPTTDEELTDALDAESAVAESTEPSVTTEELAELAGKLIQADRNAMVALLKKFGKRRASEVPDDQRDAFAAEIRTLLAA